MAGGAHRGLPAVLDDLAVFQHDDAPGIGRDVGLVRNQDERKTAVDQRLQERHDVGAGLAIGLAALGGTMGQGKAVSAALDSIGRNPSASGKIFVPMILGLALVESLVILSFVIANKLAGIVG